MMPFDPSKPANDEFDVIDMLIAAHGVSSDPVTTRFIEMALLNEGRRLSNALSPSCGEDLDRTGT